MAQSWTRRWLLSTEPSGKVPVCPEKAGLRGYHLARSLEIRRSQEKEEWLQRMLEEMGSACLRTESLWTRLAGVQGRKSERGRQCQGAEVCVRKCGFSSSCKGNYT